MQAADMAAGFIGGAPDWFYKEFKASAAFSRIRVGH